MLLLSLLTRKFPVVDSFRSILESLTLNFRKSYSFANEISAPQCILEKRLQESGFFALAPRTTKVP